MSHERLKPGAAAPELAVRLVGGEAWTLAETRPTALDMIAFYRGSFCPYCAGFIGEIAAKRGEFQRRGINPIAISMDPADLARQAVDQWGLGDLPVGYGLDLATVRAWQLFLTSRVADGREMTFSEPAVMFVTPDKRIYAMIIQSLPCGRPDIDNMLQGLDFLAEHNYPMRGSA